MMSKLFRYLKWLIFAHLVVGTLLLVKLFFYDIPLLRHFNPGRTAFMDLYHGEIQNQWVPLSQISTHLARAVVASEDSRFYQHSGLDLEELKASFEKNLKNNSYQRGGSTIPMQLAKNLYLTPNKSLFRKALEIVLALKMNADLPKERILEIYLNVIEWGDGIYGAEAAARHYFKKSAKSLTSYESAYLAAIIPDPIDWGHVPPGPYVRGRTGVILARMNLVPAPNLKNLLPTLFDSAPGTMPAKAPEQPAKIVMPEEHRLVKAAEPDVVQESEPEKIPYVPPSPLPDSPIQAPTAVNPTSETQDWDESSATPETDSEPLEPLPQDVFVDE